MTDAPDFTVLINTRDHPAELRECLRALDRQTFAPERWEIVVVDDGSRDPEAVGWAVGEGRAARRIVRLEPSGRSAARNAGVRAARGRYVLFLGDDILAEPDLIEAHARAHERKPGAAIVGHRTEQSRVPSRVFLEWWDNLRFQDIRDADNATFAFFYTCNVSVPRRALLDAGGFDENFTRYGWEDLDLGLRLEQIGLRVVYDKAARAAHVHPNCTLASLCRREYEMAFTACYFFQKWPDEPLVQAIPFWRSVMEAGGPQAHRAGPEWRRAMGRRLTRLVEICRPESALLRKLYARLIFSYRAAGLRDGALHYAPLLEERPQR